jgi:hypothetical protein
MLCPPGTANRGCRLNTDLACIRTVASRGIGIRTGYMAPFVHPVAKSQSTAAPKRRRLQCSTGGSPAVVTVGPPYAQCGPKAKTFRPAGLGPETPTLCSGVEVNWAGAAAPPVRAQPTGPRAWVSRMTRPQASGLGFSPMVSALVLSSRRDATVHRCWPAFANVTSGRRPPCSGQNDVGHGALLVA